MSQFPNGMDPLGLGTSVLIYSKKDLDLGLAVFLASAWPSPNPCSHFGSKPADGESLCNATLSKP